MSVKFSAVASMALLSAVCLIASVAVRFSRVGRGTGTRLDFVVSRRLASGPLLLSPLYRSTPALLVAALD
jgi:hypothetical protein